MRPGKAELMAVQKEVTGRMAAGDDIAVVLPVGTEGTLEILKRSYEALRKRLSAGFLEEACAACRENCIEIPGSVFDDIMEFARKGDVHAYLPLGKSGFLGGLWMMAEASGTGLRLDLRRIPVLQHTIEVCEVTGENPYMIPSGGSLLLALKSGEAFCSELRRRGIPAECCGQANTSNDRLLYSGEITRYLDKPPKELRPGFNPAGAGAEQEKK